MKGRKEKGKKCTSAASCNVAPVYGDHTGSRATGWLTEINQRGHTCMIEACFYVNAVSWAISGMMHNGKAKSQSTVWFTRTPWFTWDNLETASTCRCNRLVRFTKQVHRADQALLPARVDSFVGCSLHCALHPPAMMLELVALFPLWNRGGHTHMASKAKLEPQKNIPRKKTQQKQPTTQKRKRKKEPRKRTPYVWPRPQKTGGP